jgi:hypothetical protein
MRTTLTLDDDVAKEIAKLQRQRGTKWKALVNEALRVGLVQMQRKQGHLEEPPTQPRDLGRCRLGEIVSVSEALALGEDEGFR